MVIIEDDEQSYISLMYPIVRHKGCANGLRWETYGRWIYACAVLNVWQLVFAILLTKPTIYSDHLFNILAGTYALLSFVRIFRLGKSKKIVIAKCDSVRLAPPIAWLELVSFLAGLGVMMVVLVRQMGLSTYLSPDDTLIVSIGENCAYLAIILTLIFPVNAVAFLLGVGRKTT